MAWRARRNQARGGETFQRRFLLIDRGDHDVAVSALSLLDQRHVAIENADHHGIAAHFEGVIAQPSISGGTAMVWLQVCKPRSARRQRLTITRWRPGVRVIPVPLRWRRRFERALMTLGVKRGGCCGTAAGSSGSDHAMRARGWAGGG